VIESMQRRLDRHPDAMTLRRRTVEHVSTEMSLHVPAYHLKRVLRVLGIARTMKAMKLAGA